VVLHDYALYKSTFTYYFTLHVPIKGLSGGYDVIWMCLEIVPRQFRRGSHRHQQSSAAAATQFARLSVET